MANPWQNKTANHLEFGLATGCTKYFSVSLNGSNFFLLYWPIASPCPPLVELLQVRCVGNPISQRKFKALTVYLRFRIKSDASWLAVMWFFLFLKLCSFNSWCKGELFLKDLFESPCTTNSYPLTASVANGGKVRSPPALAVHHGKAIATARSC